MTRPPVTLLTRPPVWLGGGTHLTQMADVVRSSGQPGDRVVEVGSLRGGSSDVRLPAGVVARLGPRSSRALGAVLWRRRCVHRASVDLPPALDEIVSILDLAPAHFSDEGTLPPRLGDQVRRARGVVVSTEVIAAEVTATLRPNRVWVVPPAVPSRFFLGERPADQPDRARYVLHLGGATKRKGLDRLSAAWPSVQAADRELTLVLAGPPHPTGRAALLGQSGVQWLGQVSNAKALDLMAHAAAVVVPSTYEGFGMPVAEAMALGTPVVVLQGGATDEVGGDVAYRAPASADGLAEAILSAVGAREQDPPRLQRGVVRARRWSVDAVAATQLATYLEAFG